MQEYYLSVEHWPSEAVTALGFKAIKCVFVVHNLPESIGRMCFPLCNRNQRLYLLPLPKVKCRVFLWKNLFIEIAVETPSSGNLEKEN